MTFEDVRGIDPTTPKPQNPTTPPPTADWYARRGWVPFPFQLEAWDAYGRGASGLIHAPTGMGKSYAAWFGPLQTWMEAHPDADAWATLEAPPLTVLWITPLRALATDTTATLQTAVDELGLPWTVEKRTGDTSSSAKSRQRERAPTALVTTPESLSLLLSYPDCRQYFRHLQCVVVDEWHELLGTKRGIQTELALARLRRWQPGLRVWGLSATLGNLEQALAVLMGVPGEHDDERPTSRLIAGDVAKELWVDTLIPDNMERFPWAGHLGIRLLPEVADAVRNAGTTLVFTNTRAQTELWFQAMIDTYPEFAGEIALHHGSLDPGLRAEIEDRLRDGRLRCVICTSSLDLGVDFSPVDQVIQVGSPKGVARLMQRAGRSGHRPGAVSRILCVPTHAFELVEFAAARRAIDAQMIEARVPLAKPLDVLAQHLVTVALGDAFVPEELLDEVRTTHAYHDLTDDEWAWALGFVTDGGALRAYPQYKKLAERDGVYRAATRQIAQFHRMSIGTITSDGMMSVKYVTGGGLGSVEESFVARLKPGDRFVFAGRVLELVRVKEMTAFVRKAKSNRGIVPRWGGARMPLSSQLAGAVRVELAAARRDLAADESTRPDGFDTPELTAMRPILEIQARWSRIPAPGELLIESTQSRDGHHLFVYPMAGRLVHEGLSTLVAYRLAQAEPRTISAFATDYGFELLATTPLELDEADWRRLLSTENLLDDVLACVNGTELARRQFRDVARVAGLIFSGYPGGRKSTRQLQASSGVLFDVFQQYDPANLLLDQARREVLQQQLDMVRLESTLVAIAHQDIVQVATKRLTPLAFPIWADRMRTQVSTETWSDRVGRMVLELEEVAEKQD